MYCESPVYGQNEKNEPVCSKRYKTGKCTGKKPVTAKKYQGRNEKCNCGSGVKFKNCCWRIIVETL